MKEIDISEWKRKKHYEFYKNYTVPLFSITVQLDITDFIHYIKKKNIRFFPTFIYIMMNSMNEIDEFKYRIRKDKVVLHDFITPSYTVLNEEELYVFCTTEYNPDYKIFVKQVEIDIEKAKKGNRLEDIPGRDDLVFISSLPWISFSQTTHPIDTLHPDSFPRITFGKYYQELNKFRIPICVYVHHGLCDGLHVSRFYQLIQDKMAMFINQKI